MLFNISFVLTTSGGFVTTCSKGVFSGRGISIEEGEMVNVVDVDF